MIAYLKGKLIHKSPISVIVDVQGVGYEAFIPLSTYYELPEIGATVAFKIHAHIREDAFKLFGFLTEEEKKVFETLITVNKVGPKMALTILSGLSVSALLAAVSNNDTDRLNSIPGVGRKTAERLILELKDKLENVQAEAGIASTPSSSNGMMEDALSALMNLGYKKPQAENALKTASASSGESATLEQLIKESLKVLS